MTTERTAAVGQSERVRHLRKGTRLPEIALPSTRGGQIALARTAGLVVAFFYPWTGRPGLPNPPNWDDIPGAHGSTPEAEGFRNLIDGFQQLGITVFGVSTQDTAYQAEFAARLQLPFALLSDAEFRLQEALQLPLFETGGVRYLERLTLALRDGRIERIYHPIPFPAAHAREVCASLGMMDRSH